MTKKLLLFLVNVHIKSLFLCLLIFNIEANAETEVIAKSGDTLFKLSKQYNISLKELMHKNNFNDANKIIEGEIILIPSKNLDNENNIKYKVLEGDTIYKIARKYQVKPIDIISLNKMDDVSYLKIGEIIYLPITSIYKKDSITEKSKKTSKKVYFHQKSEEESLSEIAKMHNIQMDEIMSLNKINDPIYLNSKSKLKVRESKSDNWLKYNSIMVKWSDWTYFDGNYITKAKNKKNKPFFIAISCEKRTLNNTLNNSIWAKWYFPKDDFEYKLINDFCNQEA
tara:strand:+ start:62 stop:907 length:846 start_codon:yes stop_codon:yes gene_type:complete